MVVNDFFDPRWGIVLRKMRKSRQKTERDVADATGYSHVAVQHWEAGETPIKQQILYMLLDCYEYSLLDFASWLDKEPKP